MLHTGSGKGCGHGKNDRYTRHHNLDHLIWVYTSGDSAWYPGDDCVDVVSLYVYTDASSSMSNEWEAVLKDFNGRKLIALSESGTIPDPDKIRMFGVWWFWFSVWNGNFIHDVNKTMLKRVYDDADIITLDELPDWRHYGSNGDKKGDKVTATLFPNPAKKTATVHIALAAPENVSLELFNVLGQRLLQYDYGRLSQGVHDLELNYHTLAPGVYMVRIKAESGTFSEKITVIE